ncbi:MAG: hypothetical protein JNM10_02665 [Planctomycetia bacterium]|nr:hypothetical protein [Planctomycetia bacterium]
MTTQVRTFDCPWCGAISPVPADHLGEHYPCPECRQATKLTPKNTSNRPPTAPPPDAPHTSGHRTFDCPWCGAIAPIPASHLGERFHCPECGKETKLTPTNTRSAALTAPPPDAPHVEVKGGGRGVLVAVALVTLGAAVWFFAGRPSEPTPSAASAERPDIGRKGADRPEPPPLADPPEAPPAAPAPSVPAPAAMTEPPPPAAPTPPDVERVALQAELAKATEAAAEATRRHEEARAALAAHLAAHPDADRAAADAVGFDTLRAERARLATGAATVAASRAARTAMVAFVEADPARVALADRVLAWLRTDLDGREAASAASWRDLHWSGDGVDRALSALTNAAAAAAVPPPADLVRAEADLRLAREAATRRADEARARLEAAPAPR